MPARTRSRTAAVLATTAVAAWSLAALGSPALAAGVHGTPQPELAPFTLANHAPNGGGSVAVTPGGGLIAAYLSTSGGAEKTAVCVLPRAARSCSHTTTLLPAGDSSADGSPQVFVLGGDVVDVALTASPNGSYVYRSTNGGVSFATPVFVGTLDVDEAEVVGGQLVFSDEDDRFGAEVESVPVDPTVAPATVAVASTPEAEDIALGTRHGDVLVANGDFSDETLVSEAAAGSNFDASSSYTRIATLHDENLIAMSGDALLTESTKGSEPVQLRIFNGTTFGPPHTVPDGTGPGPDSYALVTDPSGRIHVFTVLAANGYDLHEQSTSTGTSWTRAQNLGSAITDNTFAGALGRTGAGAVLATEADGKVRIYPILPTQSISFALSRSSAKHGHRITADGVVHPASSGRHVSLQRLSHGRWYPVATTHESGSGRYSFRITASTSTTYRAVAADEVGVIQYGYSAGHALHVIR